MTIVVNVDPQLESVYGSELVKAITMVKSKKKPTEPTSRILSFVLLLKPELGVNNPTSNHQIDGEKTTLVNVCPCAHLP